MRVAFALTLPFVLSSAITVPASPPLALSEHIVGRVEGPRLRILVRVDVDASIKDVAVADALADIRRIWAPHVDLEFVDAADIVESTFDDEVRLFITNPPRAPTAENPYALGWITFPEQGRPSNIVTVSAGAARNLRMRGQWRGWRLLDAPASIQKRFLTRTIARSAAHELGHYLLRSPAHTGWGLMRAQMSADDIMTDDPGLVRLDAALAAQLEPRAWLAQTGTPPARGRS